MNNDHEDEYDENELYNSWMKKLRRLPKLHPKSCNDKCGCFPPKKKENEISINSCNKILLTHPIF